MPAISGTVIPTGGAVQLTLTTAPSGSISLQRAVSGIGGLGPFTTLYSGAPFSPYSQLSTPYIDVGDQLPAPLNPSTLYVYQLTDVNGSVQTPPIQPAVELNIQQEPITQILIRLLQAGINSLAPQPFNTQPGKVPQVLYDMPLVGFPAMPFVTVNLELGQQREIPIGQNVPKTDSEGNWVITGFARWIYRVTILGNSSVERDFYRDAVLGIFQAILTNVFAVIGKDIRHSWQFSNGQVAAQKDQQIPGFYYSEIMLEFEGVFNTLITITYGVISTITFTGTTPDGTEIQVQVPP